MLCKTVAAAAAGSHLSTVPMPVPHLACVIFGSASLFLASRLLVPNEEAHHVPRHERDDTASWTTYGGHDYSG